MTVLCVGAFSVVAVPAWPGITVEVKADQFLMGNDLLVAPMVTNGTSRTVLVPPGKWKADDGTVIVGPAQKTFDVPLGRLLYFERR